MRIAGLRCDEADMRSLETYSLAVVYRGSPPHTITLGSMLKAGISSLLFVTCCMRTIEKAFASDICG